MKNTFNKLFNKKYRSFRYHAWLVVSWVRMVLAPQATDHLSAFAKTVRYGIAVLIAAIPISFYLVQPDDQRFAEASNTSFRPAKVFPSELAQQAKIDNRRSINEQQMASVTGSRMSQTQSMTKPVEQSTQQSIQQDRSKQMVAMVDESAGFREHQQLEPVQQSSQRQAQLSSQRPAQQIAAQAPVAAKPVKKQETAMEHARKHADPDYVCPMHPEIISKDPNATCPICGMDLVKVDAQGESGVVTLTPTVVNSLGVRTSKVNRKTLYRKIDSVGYVSEDENSIRTINLRTEGWIERLAVKTVGERVKKGQLLLEVYSPKLVNAQEEYVQARALGNDVLVQASRDRLRSLGVSNDQIKKLRTKENVQQQIKVYAPQDGVLSELNIREGMFVKPSTALIKLVDLSSVWLMAEVFERQADWVKVGQRAEAYLSYMPDKSWEGKVEYVYPSLDPQTRSLKVRLRFDNPEEQLKPNMYANVNIYAQPKRKVLTIPREALIRTGNEQRVIVAMGEGKFMPMKVRVGIETDKYIEILDGLGEGDEVVTSSQFLIDSESSMRASLARLRGE
ncbi:efflux RND transporter periplasmic adaptor subunit [Kaarinaea lacus]